MADASDAPVAVLNVPTLYVNSLAVGLASTDVNVLLMVDNQPQLRLHMSFTTAKTLQGFLAEAFANLEKATGRQIMVSGEIEQGLRKLIEKPKK